MCRALPSLSSGNNFRAENWSSTIFEIYFRDPSGDVFILFFSLLLSHISVIVIRERERRMNENEVMKEEVENPSHKHTHLVEIEFEC